MEVSTIKIKEYLGDLVFPFELDVGGVSSEHVDFAVVCSCVDVHSAIIMIFNFVYNLKFQKLYKLQQKNHVYLFLDFQM
jgi:hypothetical protein